jgi:hypothetical protein
MKKEDSRKYKKAFSDSLLIIFFTVMPTIFSWFLIGFGIVDKSYTSLYDEGELFLYSISFLGSAYVIYKQLNHDLFKNFGNLIVALLFFISIAYSASSLDFGHKTLGLILILSIAFLIISVILLFCSQVVSNKEPPPDIRGYRNTEQNKIENALE